MTKFGVDDVIVKYGIDAFVAAPELALTSKAFRKQAAHYKDWKKRRVAGADQPEVDVPEELADPIPWPKPVDGAALVGELVAFLQRYLVLPPNAALAIALFILHSWTIDAFFVSPILAISSPLKRAGKTTLLRLLHAVTRRPFLVSNTSTAGFFPLHRNVGADRARRRRRLVHGRQGGTPRHHQCRPHP